MTPLPGLEPNLSACLSPEMLSGIYAQAFDRAQQFGTFMLACGLVLGAIIGIALWRLYKRE